MRVKVFYSCVTVYKCVSTIAETSYVAVKKQSHVAEPT